MTASNDDPVRIGRFELAFELSQGPLGTLHAGAVVDGPEEGRLVALRRIHFGNAQARKAAARAAEVARSLRHPRVAAVLDVLERDDELIVVSEYIEGESLGTLLRRAIETKTPISPSAAIAIVRDAAEAGIAARNHFSKTAGGPPLFGGLVPDGLRVAIFGETILMEPGILAGLGGAAFRPPALSYRAPEQREGQPASELTEVYALGVVLWEMLANRPLFRSRATAEEAARVELEKLVRAGDIQRLDKLTRQSAPLHSAIASLVDGAVRKYPELRLQSLEALRTAIDDLPRDLCGSTGEIVVTLERLAHDTLESRRSALRSSADGRISLSPESKRSTARPPGPESPSASSTAVITHVPGLPVMRFSEAEAPTAKSKPTPHGLEPAQPPIVEKEAAPEAAQVEPESSDIELEAVEAEATEPLRIASESSGVSVIEDTKVDDTEQRARPRRRLTPIVVGVVLVAAVSVIAVGLSKRGNEAQPSNPSDQPSATADTPNTLPSTTDRGSEHEPPASATTTDSAEPPPSAAASEEPEPEPSHARPAPKEQEPRPKNPKNFRPKGI